MVEKAYKANSLSQDGLAENHIGLGRVSNIYSKNKELIKLASKGDIVPFVKKKLDGSLDAEHLYLFCKDCGKKLLEMGSLILIPREEP